jgi:hypothetical protein
VVDAYVNGKGLGIRLAEGATASRVHCMRARLETLIAIFSLFGLRESLDGDL